jgi:uncharacterized membrane protein
MMMTSSALDPLNSRLARFLGFGSWVSFGLIAAGMLLEVLEISAHGAGPKLVSAGIVLLMALPILCVAKMGMCFLLRRELDFALVAALILAITIASTLFGLSTS